MARRKKNREINIFSASAIDLFASSLGVFIVLVIILFPYMNKTSKVSYELIGKMQQTIKVMQDKQDSERQVQARLRARIEDLTKQLVEMTKSNSTKTKEKTIVTNTSIDPKIVEDLRIKVVRLETEKKELYEKIEQKKEVQVAPKLADKKTENALRSQINVLKEKLHRAEQKVTSSSSEANFAAVLLKWESQKHDIDLIIRDPKGKEFNFKNRKFKKHPGVFVLDSRSGPGAEVWQTDKIISGNYKIKIKFYNNYGNTKPAIISGTIITKKGSFEIKKFNMDFSKKREKVIKFKISPEGQVSL